MIRRVKMNLWHVICEYKAACKAKALELARTDDFKWAAFPIGDDDASLERNIGAVVERHCAFAKCRGG